MGFGEGISTIWQDDDSSSVNESTSQPGLWCSVPGAHLGTRDSGIRRGRESQLLGGWGGKQVGGFLHQEGPIPGVSVPGTGPILRVSLWS